MTRFSTARILVFAFMTLAVNPASAESRMSACADLGAAMDDAPAGSVLLASYPTAPPGPLKGTAFLYDNAAASIALVGCGQRAKGERIGDAILYVLGHDRYFRDGRLRNAYAAGAMAKGDAKLSGWWDRDKNAWLEDSYQAGSDTGNMAWAMLALMTLDRANAPQYRVGAVRIGNWLLRFQDNKAPGGFRGGVFGHEPAPRTEGWKSTEHNTDVAAAFFRLGKVDGDARWNAGARRADMFISAMWKDECACFAVGTKENGITPNAFVALDAQAWPLIALPGAVKQRGKTLVMLERLRAGGGFSYAQNGKDMWTEGTAQVALLFGLLRRGKDARGLLRTIENQRAPGGYYFATNAAVLPTGFMLDTDPAKPRVYYRLPHLGATAWVALAEKGFNPFTGTSRLPGGTRDEK